MEYIRRDKTRASEKEEDRVYQERQNKSKSERRGSSISGETKQEQVRKKRIEYMRRQNKSK